MNLLFIELSDSNPFEEYKQNKPINQLDFEITHDSEIRREIPIEEFDIKTGIKNRNSKPMSPKRLKIMGSKSGLIKILLM